MTIENWLTIAVIISTLTAPTVAEFIKSRINHPIPTPETSHPKNLIQRIGGWIMRFLSSPWILPPFGMLINIGTLVWALRSSAPITRGVVFLISSTTVGIAWSLVNMNILLTQQTLKDHREILYGQTKTDREIVDLIGAVKDGLKLTNESVALAHRLQAETDKRRPGRRLLTAINKLLGK